MDLASIYLNDFTVKTNILHTTLGYVQKNTLKFFNALFCLVVFSCLSIIAGLTIPFREKWNSTFMFFSSSLFGPTCFPKKQTFHIYSNKKENPHESSRESVDPQKHQCVNATSIWFFWTWAESKSRRETVLMQRVTPLHTSLYFHDFPHVEMLGFSVACHVTMLNWCDCDKFEC